MRNTGITIILFLSTIIVAIVALVACSPTSDSSSSSSTPSSSLTGTWERSCYSANDEDGAVWDPVRLYGKQEVVITSETLTSTTTGFTDSNCAIEIGTVVVTGKYLIGDDVEVYPVKEAEVFDLAKVSATRAGLYQLAISITPKSATAVEYLKGSNNADPFYGYIKIPLESCQYEGWALNQATSVTQCHSFEPYGTSDIRYTTDQKAFAVFQVSGNQLQFEVRNDAYPTYFGLNSFTKR